MDGENATVVANAPESAEAGLANAANNTGLPSSNAKSDPTPPSNEPAPPAPKDGDKPNGDKPKDGPKEGPKAEDKPADKPADKTEDKADGPIKDWNKVKLDLPDGSVDKKLIGDFGKIAVDLGLTEKQAKGIIDFQLEAVAKQREALMEAGVKELREAWGAKASENQQAVTTLLANLDRQLGDNRFTKALNQCGATLLPDVCKGLLVLAKSVSEDSMGRGGSGAPISKSESALEALQAEWEKARGTTR